MRRNIEREYGREKGKREEIEMELRMFGAKEV